MTYYTPTIEEFYPGFEFQEFYAEGWHDRICWKDDFQNILSSDKDFDFTNYRVKYLDEQDIKKLGWKEIGSSESPFTKMIYTTFEILVEVGFNTGIGYHLVIIENHKVKISVFEYSSYGAASEGITLFCKNKSELIKLMNQLGI